MATRSKTKTQARQASADKRPKAIAKYVRISPRKVKIVIDLIRGKNVDEAAAILTYNQSAAAPEESVEYDIRGLTIQRESHKCTLFGRELSLTPIEFSILWYLCSRQGRVVPSEELFEAVWKEKYLQNSNNTVMAHIARLREKMNEPPRNPKFIKTVWGVGYEIE